MLASTKQPYPLMRTYRYLLFSNAKEFITSTKHGLKRTKKVRYFIFFCSFVHLRSASDEMMMKIFRVTGNKTSKPPK
jgi:hypothetical protein